MENMENKSVTEEKEDQTEVVEETTEVNDTATVDTDQTEPSSEEQTQVEPDERSAKIEQLENELEETKNRLLRTQADFDNYRRRVRLDQEAAEKYRAQSLISDILPALDNFERALAVDTSENEAAKSLAEGMEMVYRQLIGALEKEGLEEIEAVGKEFDPHLHQAVMQVEDENFDSNVVVEAFQKGYKLNDRVIRPTMVKVNQ